MEKWFYALDNERFGPVDRMAFEMLIAKGRVKRSTLVWRKGMAQWMEACAVDALAPCFLASEPSNSLSIPPALPTPEKQAQVDGASKTPSVPPARAVVKPTPPSVTMPSEWFRVLGGAQVGPVTLGDLEALAKQGQLSQADLVWAPSLPNWTKAGEVTALAACWAKRPGVQPDENLPVLSKLSDDRHVGKASVTKPLPNWKLPAGLYTTAGLLGFVVMVLSTGEIGHVSANELMPVAVLYSLLMITSSVFLLRFLYLSWKGLDDGRLNATPTQAWAFLLIPLFNLYWAFRAWPGFFTEAGHHAERHGLRVQIAGKGLAIAWVVCFLLAVIPIVQFVASPAATFLGVLTIRNMHRGLAQAKATAAS